MTIKSILTEAIVAALAEDAATDKLDKEVEKIEDDEELEESVKIEKPVDLIFGRVIDLQSTEKKNPSKWDRATYDALVKKFGKTAKEITSFESIQAGSSKTLRLYSGEKFKNAKTTEISLIGGSAKISVTGENSNTPKTTYAKINRK